jgi:ribosomal protein S18 acetylase RimI-like enzyme
MDGVKYSEEPVIFPEGTREEDRVTLPGETMITARKRGRYIGGLRISLEKDGQFAIFDVFVHEKYRGKGIGGGLIRHAIDHIRAAAGGKGAKVWLFTELSNTPALKLYIGNGFVQKHFPPRLAKNLSSSSTYAGRSLVYLEREV